ncbi:dienelactone hydrolase family protein [Cytophagales bacterium LB-30]|uniref:Dienelactone hydrolase family protein n=1 Tax=Shiella aurantiaca TaxID=3058365 RepID=A0ABT8F8Q1_9BACT|nr:dienelactone hydrolase family protein [Shiella aurantiaca]MDN4166586.1 dienelactone hydrolase family protein [Shiella aurantiaca]
MDQSIINLFDEYTHKPLSRSEFLKRLAVLTGSTAAALAVLPLLEVNYAQAQTTQGPFKETWIEIPLEGGTPVKAFVATPDVPDKVGVVLVIHENRGLNPHIIDVARRVAKAGYVGIAVDSLSSFGGTPEDSDKARTLIGELSPELALAQYQAAFAFAQKMEKSNGNVGCVGFCWGGAMANRLAVSQPELKAAVAFYGRQAAAEEVPNIKTAVQLHYAGLDERINAGIEAYEAALKANSKTYELYVYEGVNHAFHNDTAPTRYNAEAAQLAWERTLAFFGKYL